MCPRDWGPRLLSYGRVYFWRCCHRSCPTVDDDRQTAELRMFAKFGSKRHQVETAVSLRRTMYGQDSLGVIPLPMSAASLRHVAGAETADRKSMI